MKKLFLTALALSMTLLGSAQLVEVASVDRVALPAGIAGDVATISPDGSYAVLGQMGGSTLWSVDLSNGRASVLATDAVPTGITISPDGANVVYRTYSFNKDHMRLTGLNCVNVSSGDVYTLVKPSRDLNAGLAISADGITAIQGGKARTRSFHGASAAAIPVASINYGHLDITVGGRTTTIDPQGRGSYLWPSISPDGTKVVYTLSGAGAFVCNLDGSDVRPLGRLHAPRWMGNDLVVGMNDFDNGEEITASEIIVADFAGTRQTISLPAHVALYPSASTDAKAVTYCTADGQLYVITLK